MPVQNFHGKRKLKDSLVKKNEVLSEFESRVPITGKLILKG